MTDQPRLELLPAVDISQGEAVQLVQGIAGSGGHYGDPWEAAKAWQDHGAEWLHLVDLDAAFGRGSNREVIDSIVGRLDIHVELSGGIRDPASLSAALATGCRRVNIGTAALEDPEWTAAIIAEHGDRVAIGLDVRGTRLAARGWTSEGGDLWETLDRLDREGCARYVVSPRVGCRRSMTCVPFARWSVRASRVRSSDPPCTQGPSRFPRHSTSRGARPDDRTTGPRIGSPPPTQRRAGPTRRLGRSGLGRQDDPESRVRW